MKYILATIAMLWASSAFALSDSVTNAYALCKVIDGTGMSSAPCEVSGWNSSVVATLDMTSADARTSCRQIAGLMEMKGLHFTGTDWTLQIKSPYSGDKTIAFCKLPK
ncbi:MAG TPA: hypothetical protein VGC14_20450 [Rhizobium sp.]